MKKQRFFRISPKDKIWLVALLLLLGLFSFLLWLTDSKSFWITFLLMTAACILIVGVAIWLCIQKNRKYDEAFRSFLYQPSAQREETLLAAAGKEQKDVIAHMGQQLRSFHVRLEEAKGESAQYQEFIESWVHEIKTPLALMTLVLDNRREEMSPLVYQRFSHIRGDMVLKVEQILYYAKLNKSHKDYRLRRLDLKDLVQEVLEELEHLIKENDVHATLEIENGNVFTDDKTFRFILGQVLSNSVKYIKARKNKEIAITGGYDALKDKIYLSIKDSGFGVKASDLPFAFDKGFTAVYHQGSHSTGIGLYLVKTLCEELELEVAAKSEYESFFEITFYFPLVEG